MFKLVQTRNIRTWSAKQLQPVGPHGQGVMWQLQGILQQLALVEGCVQLILQGEARSHSSYKWIFRTRVDTYWTAPAPPITSLDQFKYTVPEGSHCGGLNDRLGIGKRDMSMVALQRMAGLEKLTAEGYR